MLSKEASSTIFWVFGMIRPGIEPYWVLSKEASTTIIWVFGMIWPGIEPRSPEPLANTLPLCQWADSDLSSIPCWVRLNTQKVVLDASLLNTQHYKVRIKDKWSTLRKVVALSLTPWCSSYWKGSIVLNYGLPTKFIYLFLLDLCYVIA